ncbi:MAG: DUF512 domain-containing protein [Defluviitaleaceae bacterium]|nr:DUF512 domain-containing protein [Defluviitaleaceae bacterium]MCL2837039.1 DUF512 domain-containing protein [Defluviitaleaceae bacterium]
MRRLITSVTENSPAGRAGILAGDFFLSLNGGVVLDVFDYRFLSNEESLSVGIERNGLVTDFIITKDECEDIGLVFGTGLMDSARGCENNCVFCFVAQNPPGMRETLYFRDDDWRLSFLTGSYITMTNMRRADFARLRFYRLSPMNISVQAASPAIRRTLLRNKRAGTLMKRLRALKRAGTSMNFQIVLCKGINDGPELVKSINKLVKLMPNALSLSVVPVGITKHRGGLYPLEPFTPADARAVIAQVHELAFGFRAKYGTSFVWAADEFYIRAGVDLPGYEDYEGFPQLENGVGMMALFREEFNEEFKNTPEISLNKTVHIATGQAAEPFISELSNRLCERFKGLIIKTAAVPNHFFGETVTVSGLVTGRGIADAFKGRIEPGAKLLIPQNMLRSGEDVFLDDMTVKELEEALNVSILKVPVNGAEFIRTVINL